MSEMNSNPISVFCHICGSQQQAFMNQQLGELECTICQSTFVEEINQGVEDFLTVSNNSPSQEAPVVHTAGVPRELDHNQLIQQILGRVLGINGGMQEEEPGIAIIHSTQGNTRRPVGVLIRHASVGGDALNSTGLFGLLNSISNIRQSHNPDALSNAQFEQFLHHILMNESSHAGAPPASETALKTLPKVTISETTDLTVLGECCISQEPFENGDTVVCLPCGHNYKEEPIVHWLKMHNTCPVCRIEINTTTSSNEN